jgi:hypothetical protein
MKFVRSMSQIDSLIPSCDYVWAYNLPQSLVNLYFTHAVYLWASCDSQSQKAIISFKYINQLIFLLEKRCVFFEVCTEFLNINQICFGFKGCT